MRTIAQLKHWLAGRLEMHHAATAEIFSAALARETAFYLSSPDSASCTTTSRLGGRFRPPLASVVEQPAAALPAQTPSLA